MFKFRELAPQDLEAINRWRNDPDIIRQLGAPFRYINLDVDKRWYENYLNNRGSAVRLAICTDECDDILGLGSLLDIDSVNRSCTIHLMIGQENQGRGAGTFAMRELVRHAFDNLNLNRVELEVVEGNARGRHIYEKIGFVLEGKRRNALYKEGKYINNMVYGILRGELKD